MSGAKPFVIGRTEWLKNNHARASKATPARSSRPAKLSANTRAVPQIVFKVAKNGGCHGPNGLGAQMDYVLGKADQIIDPSKTFDRMDHLPKEFTKALAEQWSNDWSRKVNSGHSMHMIASFPRGTDPDAVAEIIRATCHDILDQGRSRFDYIAAVHNDTDHPHAHIIVDRRNAEGEFFYFAKDHEFTYDTFKDRIVEHAADHGIELVNSSKLSRGITRDGEPHAREALRGLAGTLVAHGVAPYQNKPKERASYFVTVQSPQGEKTLWGKELGHAITAAAPEIGQQVRITHEGKEAVEVPGKDGHIIQTHRNRWAVAVEGRERDNAGTPAANSGGGADPASRRDYDDAEARSAEWKRQQVLAHADEYQGLAGQLDRDFPALSKAFSVAADTLRHGGELTSQFVEKMRGEGLMPDDQTMQSENESLVQTIEQSRNDLMAVRDRIDDMPPAERPEIEAKYFDALRDMQVIQQGHADREFSDPSNGTIYSENNRDVMQGMDKEELSKVLEGTGIDAEEVAARISVQANNAAVEAHWVESDARAIATEKDYDLETEEGREQTHKDLVDTYSAIHGRAAELSAEQQQGQSHDADREADRLGAQAEQQFERSQDQDTTERAPLPETELSDHPMFDDRDLVSVVEDRQALMDDAKALASRDTLTSDQQRRLVEVVDQTIGKEAAQELKVGNSEVLRDFGGRDDQLDLAQKYLEAEKAHGANRDDALNVVDKDRQLSAMDKDADRQRDMDDQQEQMRARNREEGLDR